VKDNARPGLREQRGQQVLAIPAGASTRQRALAALGDLQSAPGYIVRENRCHQWRVKGFFREAGQSFFYGPAEEGLLLEEILTYSPEAALSYLQRLLAALAVLEQNGLAAFELQSDGVLFLHQGGVLFLPPMLMGKIREIRPLHYRLAVHEILNHPDLKNSFPAQPAFSFAVMLYTLLCGRPPFAGDSDEELHSQIRTLRPTPPELAVPGLKTEVSELIMRGLTKAPGPAPTLKEYRRALERWAGEGFFTAISASEKDLLKRRGEQTAAKNASAYRRKVFWRRHGRLVGIIVLAVLVAGGITASWLKNILAPPATRGFTPLEVVSAFYRSINTLDHSLMDDCTGGRAGRDVIREVTQVYVITRVSSAYEGESRFLSADSWDRQARPPVVPPTLLFGITALNIAPLAERPGGVPPQESEPVYLVSYEQWRSATDEPEDGEDAVSVSIRGLRVEERVTLRKKGKDWVIVLFERLRAEEIGS
jgi:hypothetical protein